jgi:hypothetical protein
MEEKETHNAGSQSAGASGSAEFGAAGWRCPFCKKPCEVGWDCECGAKAMNRMTWLDREKPLMRGPGSDQLDAFCFGWNAAHGTAKLADPIREMIPPNDQTQVPSA